MANHPNLKHHSLFGGEFEFCNTGFYGGEFNMKFDYARSMDVANGEARPMFRVYGWRPWCLSLGFNQKEENIDKTLLAGKGYDLVRRPTGGRAVLHANELTYSVVMNLPDGKTARDVYREIHQILLMAFQGLGARLDYEKSQPRLRDFYLRSEMSVSCFASTARYELEYEGRKIVGSAQRLFGNTLLQHGSILLDCGHEQLADVISTNSIDKRNALRDFTLSHSATLSEAAGKRINFDECARAIESVFTTEESGIKPQLPTLNGN